MYPNILIKRRISKAKLSSILSRSFGLCIIGRLVFLWVLLWRPIITAAIRHKVVTDNDQNIGLYGWGNLSDLISEFIIWSWSLKMPVHIDTTEDWPFLLLNPVVGTQTLMNTAILTRNATIKSSFISRICFHTQIYINLAREMKNNENRTYHETNFLTHVWKWHTSKGSGPNHILILVIPHTTIPYKAPCWIKKKDSLLSRNLIQQFAKKSCKLQLFH